MHVLQVVALIQFQDVPLGESGHLIPGSLLSTGGRRRSFIGQATIYITASGSAHTLSCCAKLTNYVELTSSELLKMAEEEAQEPFMTSRLCVKGLPKHINDVQLRQHFAQTGEITDAKVVRAK